MDPDLRRIKSYFEHLCPADLAGLHRIYTEDAWFKDPFNEVQGLAGVRRIFEHMFAQLSAPRFQVRTAVRDGAEAFLTWEFSFQRGNGSPLVVRGASHLQLAPDGRIARHRDYWDAAEELYAKLPLLGPLMRWLRRRLAA